MTTITGRHELTWEGTALLYKRKRVAGVVSDAAHAGMWRVRLPGGPLSDMVNAVRAKDAAACLILANLNRQETRAAAPPMRSFVEAAA
jgi:hypothetical protein